MDHQQYKEWLTLALYDELDENEKILLKEHLSKCDECRIESDKLNKLHSVVNKLKFNIPDDKMIDEARQELKAGLRIIRNQNSFWTTAAESLRNILVSNYKYALSGALMLIIGLGIGYLVFSRETSQQNSVTRVISAMDKNGVSENNIRISNVRFLDSDASDGEISFSFDAVKPVTLKGNINDVLIQKVLAHSLINEKNDGIRLRTINTISEGIPSEKVPGKRVKESLITALKYDGNAGVRRQALIVLQKYLPDQEIIEAFLYVLNNDTNPGLRVAAINAINPAEINGKNVDQELIKVLKQRSSMDDNEYIRVRAKSVLEEVVQ